MRRGPRAAWDSEPEAFTAWRADNLAALGRAVGLDLERVNTEAPVASFALDLLTYASGYRAEVVVWVAETFRAEQRPAIEAELGEALTWERQDHRGSCRISLYTEGHIDQGDEALGELRAWTRGFPLRVSGA